MDLKIETVIKGAFAVIGKEGSTCEEPGFIQRLWTQANTHFGEVAHLAVKTPNSHLAGIWGAMTDFSRSFLPWEENFSQGLYLAGVECHIDAEAPVGWSRWIIPGFEYLRVECDRDGVFPEMIDYLQKRNIPLAGAVHDYTCPESGKNYMYFPIRRLTESDS